MVSIDAVLYLHVHVEACLHTVSYMYMYVHIFLDPQVADLPPTRTSERKVRLLAKESSSLTDG